MQHERIKDGWFTEISNEHFPGQGFSLKVEEVLEHQKSKYQDVLVFRSQSYGVVLVLDGIVQCTERDEFAYQEMISHVALYDHENPKRVLVIGGGDGGVVREVVKHDCVETVTLVEIDKTVIELAQRHLPSMAMGMDNPKVKLELCDGFSYLRRLQEAPENDKYDIIITDSSDPDGPAEAFFQKAYFQLLRDALRAGGVVIAQSSENVWLDMDYLKNLTATAREVFPNTQYCYTSVPSYTSGQLGLLISSLDKSKDLTHPVREPTKTEQDLMSYYNSEIHHASFVLPTWADRKINGTNL